MPYTKPNSSRRPAAARRPGFAGTVEHLERRLLFAAGDLDPSFSGDGKVITDLFGGGDTAHDVVVQPDGKVIVAGEAAVNVAGQPIVHFAAVRYNPDGSLDDGSVNDTTPGDKFGTGGKVRYPAQEGAAAHAVAVQKDGRIVLAGESFRTGIAGVTTRWQFMRLNKDGTLDQSFGSGGYSSALPGTGTALNDMTLQPDGKIVVAGAYGGNLAVGRLNPNGAFDPSFGGGAGYATTDFGGTDVAAGLALDHLGNVVAAGYTGNDLALARFRPNGAIDGNFGTGGRVTSADPGGQRMFAYAVAVRPGGDVLVAGAIGTNALYSVYGQDGRHLPTGVVSGPTRQRTDVLVSAEDLVHVAGFAARPPPAGQPRPDYDFALEIARDPGLRTGLAYAETDFGADVDDVATAVALAPGGGVVVAGYTTAGGGGSNFAVARYQGRPTASLGAISGTVFSDRDGDGVRDANEPGMANVRVYVDADNNGRWHRQLAKEQPLTERDVLTDANGNYTLAGLPPGAYRVRQEAPLTYGQTLPKGDGSYVVAVAARQTVTGRNFGNKPPSAQGTNTAIGGSVYHDLDGDGTRDVGNGSTGPGGTAEPDLGGRTVYLDRNRNGVLDGSEPRRTTDAGGNYLFEGIAAGTYRVRTVLPAGWAYTSPSAGYLDVAVASGQRVAGKQFGTLAPDPDDTIAEAKAAPAVAVGGGVSFSISNPRDVDVIRFTVRAGQRVGFDVDRAAGSTLNAYLRLFTSAGAQLAFNDNAAAPGEAGNGADSYLTRTFAAAGTYYLGVSDSANKAYNPTTGGGDVGGGSVGAYRLSLTNLPAARAAAAPAARRGVARADDLRLTDTAIAADAVPGPAFHCLSSDE